MYYELWDLRTRNLVEEFDTETDALEYVRDVLRRNGEEVASRYALGTQDLESGRGSLISDGAALVQRAMQAQPSGRPA